MGLVCGIPGAGCPGIGLVCGIPGAGCPGIVGCVSRGIGAIGPLGFVGPVDPPGVVCARSEFVPKPMLADNTAAVRVFFLFMFPPFQFQLICGCQVVRAQAVCHAGKQIKAVKSGI